MDELELYAGEKGIKLMVHGGQWCEVYSLMSGKAIALGGETLDILLPKLLTSFMLEKDRKKFVYHDMEMFFVFNLMGPHAVVAGRERDDFGMELVFLSNEGEVIKLVELSIEDMKEWISKIVKFLIARMRHT